jgi:hypothetical protein
MLVTSACPPFGGALKKPKKKPKKKDYALKFFDVQLEPFLHQNI